jgi:hypothetical protein
MNFGLAALLTTALLSPVTAEELRTLTAKGSYENQPGYSEAVTILAGEWLEVIGRGARGSLEIAVNGENLSLPMLEQTGASVSSPLPIKVAGPAQVRFMCINASAAYVTLAIHRVSSPTTPAAIPADPGQNFAVVLESSSDLVTWTPAAPGSYAGTEPKRFFRVRIDRD